MAFPVFMTISFLFFAYTACDDSTSSGELPHDDKVSASEEPSTQEKSESTNDPSKNSSAGASSSDSCSSATSGTLAINFVAVDPYITCARFCADSDGSGSCDEGEPLSTWTDSSGRGGFTQTLDAGTTIMSNDKGIHNGVPYQIAIKTTVSEQSELVSSTTYITPKLIT